MRTSSETWKCDCDGCDTTYSISSNGCHQHRSAYEVSSDGMPPGWDVINVVGLICPAHRIDVGSKVVKVARDLEQAVDRFGGDAQDYEVYAAPYDGNLLAINTKTKEEKLFSVNTAGGLPEGWEWSESHA